MKEMIPPGTEVLAGLETGGIPVATLLSHLGGIPQIFVRKKAKEYGTTKLAEGVYEIRYLDGATAKATLPGLGDRHVQGAIVVHMSPP